MMSEDMEIADEISRDVKDTYDQLVNTNKLLTGIYLEVQLLRKLAEILLPSNLKQHYVHEQSLVKNNVAKANFE
jgi:hypothetical protein